MRNIVSVDLFLLCITEFSVVLRAASMKPHSWLRRNWLWAAGGAFVTVHLVTWLMQRTMRSAARSEVALKQKAAATED